MSCLFVCLFVCAQLAAIRQSLSSLSVDVERLHANQQELLRRPAVSIEAAGGAGSGAEQVEKDPLSLMSQVSRAAVAAAAISLSPYTD